MMLAKLETMRSADLSDFVAENLSALSEDEALAVIANPFVTPQLLGKLAQNARLAGFHSVRMSSRLTKKSLVSVSGRSVNTPSFDRPKLAPSTRKPPTSAVTSGAVSVSN